MRDVGNAGAIESSDSSEQAVFVYLGKWTRDELWNLEDRLSEAIEAAGLGEFDGNELGPDDAKLFMYGRDADRLFKSIEEILRSSPLCVGARVVIRYGEPGSQQREVNLNSTGQP
jgi:hypothetical protein